MAQSKDIKIGDVRVYFLPVENRVPLKFGFETVTGVTCARVRMRVADRSGRRAEGWGETPLGVPWVWPSSFSYEERHAARLLISPCMMPMDAFTAYLYTKPTMPNL